jgi:putative membrane protein
VFFLFTSNALGMFLLHQSLGVRHLRWAVPLVLSMHFAGILGLWFPLTRPLFLMLTPFNLLAAGSMLYFFQEKRDRTFHLRMLGVMLTGFFAELIGVQTGLLFGEYTYEVALGPKIWGTPPLIGLNWWLLVCASGAWGASRWGLRGVSLALFVGFCMTGLDFFIEPVAMAFDFWDWTTPEVPLQNYIVWFILGSLLGGFFCYKREGQRNLFAPWLLLAQAIFFLSLNVLLWWA